MICSGFGAVQRALYRPSGMFVAVKSRIIQKKKELDEIKEEIEVLRESKCPYIVEYYGHHYEKNPERSKVWILMEHCLLGSLHDIIKTRERGFSEAEIANIAKCVLQVKKPHQIQFNQRSGDKDIVCLKS